MACPRCHFPSSTEPCKLCGQTDFNTFEMNRYQGDTPGRFEFTLIILQKMFPTIQSLVPENIPVKTTSEMNPRTFLFFPDGTDRKLVPILKQLHKENIRFDLLVNGRPRPYTEELWLPLLDLLAPVE